MAKICYKAPGSCSTCEYRIFDGDYGDFVCDAPGDIYPDKDEKATENLGVD